MSKDIFKLVGMMDGDTDSSDEGRMQIDESAGTVGGGGPQTAGDPEKKDGEDNNADDGNDEDDDEEDDDEEDDDDDDDDADDNEDDEDDNEVDDGEEGEDSEDDWESEDEDEEEQAAGLVIESDSDDENADNCPICLNRFKDQDIGTPEACDHHFCLECIQEWANNVNTCPVDRQVFRLILAKHPGEDKVYKKIPVEDKNTQEEEEEEEPTYCEVCGRCDREDRLLLCDGCDLGYHCECLTPALADIPVEEWFCSDCAAANREGATAASEDEEFEYRPRRRLIARTLVSERVRTRIRQTRVERALRIPPELVSSSEEDVDMAEEETPASSSGPAPSSTKKKSPVKRRKKVKRKTRKRKSTKRRKTKSTSTKRKTVGKKRRKKRRVKKRKLKRGSPRTAAVAVSTVKSRIAGKLGLTKPPPGLSIPMQKKAVEKTLEQHRAEAGDFSILGNKDDLDTFQDDENRIEAQAGSSTGRCGRGTKYSMSSLKSHRPVGRVKLPKASNPSMVVIQPAASTSSTFDILGSIMQGQSMLNMKSDDVTIKRDGSLVAKKPVPQADVKLKEKNTFELNVCSYKQDQEIYDPSDPTSENPANVTSPKPVQLATGLSVGFDYDPSDPTDENSLTSEQRISTTEYDPSNPTDDLPDEVNESDQSKVKVSQASGEDVDEKDAPSELEESVLCSSQEGEDARDTSQGVGSQSDIFDASSENAPDDVKMCSDVSSMVGSQSEVMELALDDNSIDSDKPLQIDEGETSADHKKPQEKTDQSLEGGSESQDVDETQDGEEEVEEEVDEEGGENEECEGEGGDEEEAEEEVEGEEVEEEVEEEEAGDEEETEIPLDEGEIEEEARPRITRTIRAGLSGWDTDDSDLETSRLIENKVSVSEFPRHPKKRSYRNKDTDDDSRNVVFHMDDKPYHAYEKKDSFQHKSKRDVESKERTSKYDKRERDYERREKDRRDDRDDRSRESKHSRKELSRSEYESSSKYKRRKETRSRSRSRERKDRSDSHDRRRSRSRERERSSRKKRRERSYSREKSFERERERDRDRSHKKKRRERDRSREYYEYTERRSRRSRSRSLSPRKHSERESVNKENRDSERSYKRKSEREESRSGSKKSRSEDECDRSEREAKYSSGKVNHNTPKLVSLSFTDDPIVVSDDEDEDEVEEQKNHHDIPLPSSGPSPPVRPDLAKTLEKSETKSDKSKHKSEKHDSKQDKSEGKSEKAEKSESKTEKHESKKVKSDKHEAPTEKAKPIVSFSLKPITVLDQFPRKLGGVFGKEASVYDPAHPTDEEQEAEKALSVEFPAGPVPNSASPDVPPQLIQNAHNQGPLLGENAFILTSEPGVMQPQNIPLPAMTFGMIHPRLQPGLPQRQILMNPVLLNQPPPFTAQPGQFPRLPAGAVPRFGWQVNPPAGMVQIQQNRFEARVPQGPGRMPPPGNMINGGFEPVGQEHQRPPFPPNMSLPHDHNRPPPPLQMKMEGIRPLMQSPMGPPPRQVQPKSQMEQLEEISKLLNAQAQLAVLEKLDKDKPGTHSPAGKRNDVFKVPLPPHLFGKAMMNKTQDTAETTEVVDMDMSPLDEDCELELPTPPDSMNMDPDQRPRKQTVDLKTLKKTVQELTAAQDDVPSSAADLSNKDKYLKKLHLQERVVDEVKLAIKPFYSSKKINKDEYKEILRKAVPKVCHSKSGDINPVKIKALVEAYVTKYRKGRKGHKESKKKSRDDSKANGERLKGKIPR